MFDQDGQQSKKQRERLNEQLSSLFDDDFEEDEIPKKNKRKSHKKRRDYDDYDAIAIMTNLLKNTKNSHCLARRTKMMI